MLTAAGDSHYCVPAAGMALIVTLDDCVSFSGSDDRGGTEEMESSAFSSRLRTDNE